MNEERLLNHINYILKELMRNLESIKIISDLVEFSHNERKPTIENIEKSVKMLEDLKIVLTV